MSLEKVLLGWACTSNRPNGIMYVSSSSLLLPWRTPTPTTTPPLPGMRTWLMVGALGLYADETFLFLWVLQALWTPGMPMYVTKFLVCSVIWESGKRTHSPSSDSRTCISPFWTGIKNTRWTKNWYGIRNVIQDSLFLCTVVFIRPAGTTPCVVTSAIVFKIQALLVLQLSHFPLYSFSAQVLLRRDHKNWRHLLVLPVSCFDPVLSSIVFVFFRNVNFFSFHFEHHKPPKLNKIEDANAVQTGFFIGYGNSTDAPRMGPTFVEKQEFTCQVVFSTHHTSPFSEDISQKKKKKKKKSVMCVFTQRKHSLHREKRLSVWSRKMKSAHGKCINRKKQNKKKSFIYSAETNSFVKIFIGPCDKCCLEIATRVLVSRLGKEARRDGRKQVRCCQSRLEYCAESLKQIYEFACGSQTRTGTQQLR